MEEVSGRVPEGTGLSSAMEPASGLHPSGFDPSHESFDKHGVPFMLGDVVKVFHFIGARRKRHYMYKQVVGERVWPSGLRCWTFSHLDLKSPDEQDGCFYIARDGRHYRNYEIVQCCSKYPAHFSTRPRDSDGNPKGGDGTAPSRSDDSAGPQGIAQPSAPQSSGAHK